MTEQKVVEPIWASRDLVAAVKLSSERGYRIAERAGIQPAVLSRILHGTARLREQDPRVLAVARVVDVPSEQAFAPADQEITR